LAVDFFQEKKRHSPFIDISGRWWSILHVVFLFSHFLKSLPKDYVKFYDAFKEISHKSQSIKGQERAPSRTNVSQSV